MGLLRRHAGGVTAAADRQPCRLAPRADGAVGAAFLAYQNSQIYLQWNTSLVYSTTAAYLATRIAGAPALRRGNPPPALGFTDVKAMQAMLVRAGYAVGAVDGFLGLKTRQAVK